MAEPIYEPELTREERSLTALLRQGPQSVAGLAGALQTSTGHIGSSSLLVTQTQDVVARFVRLLRESIAEGVIAEERHKADFAAEALC